MEMKKGIESFRAAVKRDCDSGEGCFSEVGCTKQRYRYEPQENPALVEMGFETKCVANTKCFHDFCGKYAWVMDRAKIYAERTGKTAEEVLEIWEEDRGYWYMNYYQEGNQPLRSRGVLSAMKILEWQKKIKDLEDSIDYWNVILENGDTPIAIANDVCERVKVLERERDSAKAKFRLSELNASLKPEVLITRDAG